jgi:hypothetical protein
MNVNFIRTLYVNPILVGAAIMLLVLLPSCVFAGAWTLEKGDSFFELASKYYWADSYYNNCGYACDFSNAGKYTEYRTEVKAEYGITDEADLLMSIPYKWARYEDDDDVSSGDSIEDITAGVKYRITEVREGFPVTSVIIKGIIPGGYDVNEDPAIGAEKFGLESRLLFGMEFGAAKKKSADEENIRRRHGFSSIGGELGYRIMEGKGGDKIPYFAEVNYQLTDNIYLRALLDGIISISTTGSEPSEEYLLSKKYEEYGKCIFLINFGSFLVTRKLPGLSLELGYGHTFYGKNTAAGSEVIVNVAYKLYKY